MDLNALADEMAEVLESLGDLRVTAYPPATVVPPAGIVSYPEAVSFDQTYGRGMDRIERWPVVLVVGKATDRSARKSILAYAAGIGTKSVKAAMESHDWENCDDLQVTSVEFDVVTIAAVDYIAATFTISVAGQGTA